MTMNYDGMEICPDCGGLMEGHLLETHEPTYFLGFTFGNSEINHVTRVEQEFSLWADSELETLVEELRNCLLACGYVQESIDRLIPSTL